MGNLCFYGNKVVFLLYYHVLSWSANICQAMLYQCQQNLHYFVMNSHGIQTTGGFNRNQALHAQVMYLVMKTQHSKYSPAQTIPVCHGEKTSFITTGTVLYKTSFPNILKASLLVKATDYTHKNLQTKNTNTIKYISDVCMGGGVWEKLPRYYKQDWLCL